jgi:hypothetical protein
MTVKKAIDTADRRMPGNEYSKEEKLGWLSTLEAMWNEFKASVGHGRDAIYVDEDNMDAELSIYAPFDEIYVIWLIMKMHYYNGEIELYNNSAEMFNNLLQQAKKSFIRENKSKTQYSFHGHREV